MKKLWKFLVGLFKAEEVVAKPVVRAWYPEYRATDKEKTSL